MSAAVVITPASGSITALVDACEITCTGVDSNTLTGYDADNYPASPAVVAFFKLSASGEDDLLSPQFTTNAAGEGAWPGSVIFPASGSWTLDLVDASDGTTVLATAAVTVNQPVLGLSGELGRGAPGEFALGEALTGQPFVPHLGAIRSADGADHALIAVAADAASSAVAADGASAVNLSLGLRSTIGADRVESEVSDE